VGLGHIKSSNWHPFLPFGVGGIFSGANLIFFAYIGFDQVSTAAEQVRDPQKTMPRGILLSLGICTVLYMAVAQCHHFNAVVGELKGRFGHDRDCVRSISPPEQTLLGS
jgi:amino acid permease